MLLRGNFRRLLALGLLLGNAIVFPALAQETTDAPVPQIRLQVQTGNILEFLGENSSSDAAFSWVLSHNGTFVEAGRERIFRTRLTEDGNYTLDAEFHGNNDSR